tara:strand:- start:4369 stop:4503 length:135 start_codon:yes stop_codon:yes gene_type:complete
MMITINDITLEVNGRLYTTKEDFDHSIICDMIDIEDLVLLEEEE